MKKHIYDIWIKWNYYGDTQKQLAKIYGIPVKTVSYIVYAKNKSEAYKRYKKIFLSL